MADWLNPLNKLKLQIAFKSKAPQVLLQIGNSPRTSKTQLFDIEYYTDKTEPTGHTRKAAVRPAQPVPNGMSPYVPMGRFDLKTVLHSEWLVGTTAHIS